MLFNPAIEMGYPPRDAFDPATSVTFYQPIDFPAHSGALKRIESFHARHAQIL